MTKKQNSEKFLEWHFDFCILTASIKKKFSKQSHNLLGSWHFLRTIYSAYHSRLLFIFRQHEKICSLNNFSVWSIVRRTYTLCEMLRNRFVYCCVSLSFLVLQFFFSGRESNIKMTNCTWSLIYGFHRLHSFFFHSTECSLKLITSSWKC